MEKKIKIAIADDHPLVVNGIHYLLSGSAEMYISGSYANGKELIAGLEQQQPDVLLLDIQMPGQTGEELAEIVSHKYPQVKMVALTNQDNVYYIKAMFSKGVHGYILKTSPEEILLDAIKTVLNGEQYLEPALKAKLVKDTLHNKRHSITRPVLTRREKEVLQQLTLNRTSQEIADALGIGRKTVETHRQSLLIKLDVKNAAALIKIAMELGLIE